MRAVLHILTRPGDTLALDLIRRQEELAGVKIVVVDLTQPAPNYRALLEKIFAADSIQTW